MLTPSNGTAYAAAPDDNSFWRVLFHRWFVKYNPVYLVSALLVLSGLHLVSRGLTQEGSTFGSLGVALLAEVYAAALVGGAALLARNGQKRPAVLLALLVVLYQGDLTLHTETCAVLGSAGVLATTLWMAIFVAKLFALSRALRVRIGARALATSFVGGTALALLPYGLFHLAPSANGAMLAVFGVALHALFPRRVEDSVIPVDVLDPWSKIVLRRVVVATWSIWSLLLVLHVGFLASETSIDFKPVVVSALFAAVASRAGERRLWSVILGTSAFVAFAAPAELSIVAWLAALTLIVRAVSDERSRTSNASRVDEVEPSPYRRSTDTSPEGAHAPPAAADVFLPRGAHERLRLFTGALVAAYVGIWTLGWRGGPMPSHHVAVDALFVAASIAMAWRLGARLVLVFVASLVGHALAATGLIPKPQTLVEWGSIALVVGFLLLFGSLAISHRLRDLAPTGPSDREPDPIEPQET